MKVYKLTQNMVVPPAPRSLIVAFRIRPDLEKPVDMTTFERTKLNILN